MIFFVLQVICFASAQTAAAGAASSRSAVPSELDPQDTEAAPYVVNGVRMTTEQYMAWQQLDRPEDTEDYTSWRVMPDGNIASRRECKAARNKAARLAKVMKRLDEQRGQTQLSRYFQPTGSHDEAAVDEFDMEVQAAFDAVLESPTGSDGPTAHRRL